MHAFVNAVVLAGVALALPTALYDESAINSTELVARQTGQCPTGNGFHLITVRGSMGGNDDNTQGGANFGGIGQYVQGQRPGSTGYGLVYPASPGGPDYISSEETGVNNLNTAITQHVDSCPTSRIVLLGYSQGAQVVMNSICGTSTPNYAATPALAGKYANAVKAAAVIADVTRVYYAPPNTLYNVGTAQENNNRQGVLARPNTSACQAFYNNGQKLRSWCANGDQYCDNTPADNGVHTSYFTPGATNYIVPNVENWILSKV